MYHGRPFTLSETHGILAGAGVTIHRSSEAFGWAPIYASLQRETPFEGHFPAVVDQLIVLRRTGPIRLESGTDAPVRVAAGSVHLVSSGESLGIKLLDPVETMHVYVRRRLIEEVAAGLIEGNPVDLVIPSALSVDDPHLERLLEVIWHSLMAGAREEEFYVDLLSRALATLLITRHSNAVLRASPGHLNG